MRVGKVTLTESHVERGLRVEPWSTRAFNVQGEKETSIEGEIERCQKSGVTDTTLKYSFVEKFTNGLEMAEIVNFFLQLCSNSYSKGVVTELSLCLSFRASVCLAIFNEWLLND